MMRPWSSVIGRMRWRRPVDTIAGRFATTILLALAGTASLIGLFGVVAGTWARPPIEVSPLLPRAADIIRIEAAVPADMRNRIATASDMPGSRADWYSATSDVSRALERSSDLAVTNPDIRRAIGGRELAALGFGGGTAVTRTEGFVYDRVRYPAAHFLAVRLPDTSWLVFTAFTRDWGLPIPALISLNLMFVLLSSAVVTAFAARQLARPIQSFAAATRRFGSDPKAPPIVPSGPRELREAAHAFNTMQAQIQKFLADRTMMLAAISHDLRTPLTRMRLRGELIEDAAQRARLFRDVDEMHAMIDGALAFFRDDIQGEALTAFDAAELVQSIVDDFGDQSVEIRYDGPDHLSHTGRPLALRRALINLIDNATRYAHSTEIGLSRAPASIVLTVRDRGPGIPAELLTHVFRPFQRLERSRDRSTGGVGLGLSAAQAVARDHGGDIVLRNRDGGGLEAAMTLPTLPVTRADPVTPPGRRAAALLGRLTAWRASRRIAAD